VKKKCCRKAGRRDSYQNSMFNVRLQKVSKTSHFRPDNQGQISLDLSYTDKNRKSLISLTSSQTFLEIIQLARCEYSKLASVFFSGRKCACIRREVCLYSKRMCSYHYSIIITCYITCCITHIFRNYSNFYSNNLNIYSNKNTHLENSYSNTNIIIKNSNTTTTNLLH
jgi:hypothetical protein